MSDRANPGSDPIDWEALWERLYLGLHAYPYDGIGATRAVIAAHSAQLRALGWILVSREDLLVLGSPGRSTVAQRQAAWGRIDAALAAAAPEMAGDAGGGG